MLQIKYTKALAQEYIRLYKTCEILPSKFNEIDNIINEILKYRSIYEQTAEVLNIPWYFIAAIHRMESSGDFTKHLHNGDPLSERTVHIPRGRPRRGKPPFSWKESAIDALKLRGVQKVKKWTLPRLLYEMEGYNGWGYRIYHPYVLTPYLWAGSNHYTSGKYIADGRWSDRAKSKQCGGALIIRRLEEKNEISFDEDFKYPIFAYADSLDKKEYNVKKLQKFLNGFEGIALRVDGNAGIKTSAAVKRVFDFYLKGDPRNAQ